MSSQALYRREFRDLILAETPRAVLEVGCGDGGLLRELCAARVETVGLEIRAESVAALRASGLDARLVHDESLPFPANTFDLVVSEYCAHHFADLARHLAEALRVARRGVFFLDPWFDASIPSQRCARRWDDWLKAIDRANGSIHNEVLTADAFLAALPAGRPPEVEVRHLLHLAPFDEAEFEAESARALETAPDRRGAAAELEALRAAKQRDGLSDDGAILIAMRHPGAASAT